MYDIIGDIHGHARELESLLALLGYQAVGRGYRHPDQRKILFLGDFIDRGPQIGRVIEIARSMVEDGQALAVMGNHEWNAIAFHTPRRDGTGFLRAHTAKNHDQHRATLVQLSSTELQDALDWFRSFPLWLELDGIRAVHACWDEPSQRCLAGHLTSNNTITEDLLQCTGDTSGAKFHAVETLLKGREIPLPPGISFTDKGGFLRRRMRARWYLSSLGHTYRSYAMSNEIDCDHPLTDDTASALPGYPHDAPPVFIGHYWLREHPPTPLAPNVACLDYSIAKDGWLCAYRWNGERTLSPEHFLSTPRQPDKQ
ncbi:MAG TPA: metallophosphoesterase [Planctomycetaceae bacterium]|jgi:hypothetical protein|nr:metallophosphoesterase [Planctomycetaceae bacterium]